MHRRRQPLVDVEDHHKGHVVRREAVVRQTRAPIGVDGRLERALEDVFRHRRELLGVLDVLGRDLVLALGRLADERGVVEQDAALPRDAHSSYYIFIIRLIIILRRRRELTQPRHRQVRDGPQHVF